MIKSNKAIIKWTIRIALVISFVLSFSFSFPPRIFIFNFWWIFVVLAYIWQLVDERKNISKFNKIVMWFISCEYRKSFYAKLVAVIGIYIIAILFLTSALEGMENILDILRIIKRIF
ncbi:MAG: hypothetical protein ABIG90_00980 [bacterium]